MLHHPPSSINLTPADVSDFDRRLALRQSAKSSQFAAARLSPGPTRGIGSFVSARDNVGRRRAESSSSQATICSVSVQNGDIDFHNTEASLNPDATVFVPRTRYGTIASPSIPVQAPNVDRYPPMRPVGIPRRKSSRQHLLSYEKIVRPHAQAVPASLRAASPAPSTSSRSTPNLLRVNGSTPPVPRIHARSSSLTWNRSHENEPRHLSTSHAGSDVDASFKAADISRNSPLDELTESLSRLITGRPRSVGRSLERVPHITRRRVSLLTGKPFDIAPDRPLSMDDDGLPTLTPPAQRRRSDSASVTDPVAVALAMPPLHQPSTPVLDSQKISSPASHSSDPRSHPPPQPHAATPRRVAVYDDSKPARLQPQTPADIARSSRRHARSGTILQRSTPAIYPDSPVPSSSMNRHTYPAASSAAMTPLANREIAVVDSATGFTPVRVTPTAVRKQIRRSARRDGMFSGTPLVMK